MKVEKWNENEDTKLKKYYKGRYTIVGFQSDTNAILDDKKGNRLPRSIYINKLKRCEIRKDSSMNNTQEQYEIEKPQIEDADNLPTEEFF